MKKVNSILKLIGVIITAFYLTICIISIIGMFQCKDQQSFATFLIYFTAFLGLVIINIINNTDEI